MRLTRTKAYDRRNIRQAAEFDIDLSEKEVEFYLDVVRLIEMRCEAQLDVFDAGGEINISVICDLNELKTFRAAYKIAKRHVSVQRKVGCGPMVVA